MIQKRLAALLLLGGVVGLSGCSLIYNPKPLGSFGSAELVRPTNFTRDLDNMPAPKLMLPVAIYGFKDQSGQYKPQPDSSFSTAVSQGGTAMLVKALKDSGWFIPVERENLQDILTERRIVRAIEQPGEKPGEESKVKLPTLVGAGMIVEGSVIGYDENVKSGGIGVKWLGLSASQQYRADQVTVNLRAVDIGTGVVMESVTTTKTVYSAQLDTGEYRFVNYQSLLEVELGTSLNEPGQIALQEAIEAAVVNLVVEGVYDRKWALKNESDRNSPLVRRYHDDQLSHVQRVNANKSVATGEDNSGVAPAAPWSPSAEETAPVKPAAPVPAAPAAPAAAPAPAALNNSGAQRSSAAPAVPVAAGATPAAAKPVALAAAPAVPAATTDVAVPVSKSTLAAPVRHTVADLGSPDQ